MTQQDDTITVQDDTAMIDARFGVLERVRAFLGEDAGPAKILHFAQWVTSGAGPFLEPAALENAAKAIAAGYNMSWDTLTTTEKNTYLGHACRAVTAYQS